MLGDLVTLSPLLIVTAVGLLVMIAGVFANLDDRKAFLGYLSAAGLGIALLATGVLFAQGSTELVTPFWRSMLVVDRFALFGIAVCLIVGILALISAVDYLPEQRCEWPEFYMLVVFAIAGMMTMVMSADLIAFFVGLEIMSISIYVLAGFKRQSVFAVEASLKYFLLGAFSTGFLLYGIAYAYGVSGSTNLSEIAAWFAANSPADGWFGYIILIMLVVAFGFKAAAVPFHMWTPDVYEGAPTPVTGLMAAGVKTATFVALSRVFLTLFEASGWSQLAFTWQDIFFWLAILTMSVGNILAVVQRNVKRTLAYSSIAHAGYLLIAVLATRGFDLGGGQVAQVASSGLLYYLLVYSVATIGAFTVLSMLGKDMEEDISFGHLAGFGYRHPFAAVAMVVFMVSLAGIPPTAGFFGKYLVFTQVLTTNTDKYLPLVIIAVLNSLVSVYYYLKVPVYMYMRGERRQAEAIRSTPMALVFGISALFVLQAGMFPSKYVTWAEKAAASTIYGAASRDDLVAAAGADAGPAPAVQAEAAPKPNFRLLDANQVRALRNVRLEQPKVPGAAAVRAPSPGDPAPAAAP
ncbi:MAG: NADH-quinone oxidoreductase subunit N [Myxococcales bacterium]